MKFFSLFVFFISVYHISRASAHENVLRIPLSKAKLNLATSHLASLNALQKNTKPVIPLENYRKLAYYGSISVGSPPQKVNVLFDTGANDLWLLSSLCKSSACVGKSHNLYNHANSTSYQIPNHEPADDKLARGTDWASGFWSTDTISVGGVVVKNRLFLEATNVSKNYENELYDGILGLGYDINTKSDNIISQLCGTVPDHKFSFYLTGNKSAGSGGQLTLCGEDESKYRGNLNYVRVPLSQSRFWQISVKKISLHRQKDSHPKKLDSKASALVNTGEPFIIGPKFAIQTIYDDTNSVYDHSTGFRRVDCKKIQEFPNITFEISSVDYTLTGEDYVLLPTDTNDVQGCTLGLKSTPDQVSEWVLGDVFLRKYYTVFDVRKQRIGFAESVHN